ncbi:hypothetical protein MAPG_04982 [Magnaporthiopsis poae ATCC 64411]|uniref:Nudix hydrolase domain-containing protein n=1 Tax=Magnaporthiopsis poae (strain ATCC 64411 / 73-15) TaxID=644358 RepID=A0A0C4DY71_MAGP6|nr:hypothetical protein MAPG_04982 [Magnaporthiopsis poae ATCC 64411]
MERRWENIDLVKRLDTFPDPALDPDGHKTVMEGFYTVVWRGSNGSDETPLGYMRRDVYDRLLQVPEALRGEVRLDASKNTVSVFQWQDEQLDEPERTRRVAAVGHVHPECEWVYDLELPRGTTPRPKDGEVESFALMDVPEVQVHLAAGRFKPNCAAVTLDFFIRRGIIDRSNEPCYDEIVRRLHRVIPFPGPHHRCDRDGADQAV